MKTSVWLPTSHLQKEKIPVVPREGIYDNQVLLGGPAFRWMRDFRKANGFSSK